ncbi:hypothetical protein BGZ83_000777 [Gryganskiella cystojenkinii]|nr:hypothetical protein BGZ83_000777 [Gryganskiella cystojenkinii]
MRRPDGSHSSSSPPSSSASVPCPVPSALLGTLPAAHIAPNAPTPSPAAAFSAAHRQGSHSLSHASSPSGSTPSCSDAGTPPIIPGPGQGIIPALTSARPTPRSGFANNSPPGQHTPYPMIATIIDGNPVKRSISANDRLQPILSKNQQANMRVSPTPAPQQQSHQRPQSISSPSSGSKPYGVDIGRVGTSPLSSPNSSPRMSPAAVSIPKPVQAPINAMDALASALPTVPASHQHSAAVSAAAAAAANRSSTTPQSSARHQKNLSGGSSNSSGSVSMQSPSPGLGTTVMHHHHHHHHHHSQQLPQVQTQSQPLQQKQHYHQHLHSLSSGQNLRLPSVGSLTSPSSPMASPLQGPSGSSRSNQGLPVPSTMSLPGPIDAYGQRQRSPAQIQGQGQVRPDQRGYSRDYPHDGHHLLPTLAPMTPR